MCLKCIKRFMSAVIDQNIENNMQYYINLAFFTPAA